MEEKFLFFDTETTDIQSKDIVQLAFVTSEGVEFNEYFKPIQDISFAAMAIHHITPEFLKDKPKFSEFKIPKNSTNSDFDGKFLLEYLEYLTREYVWVAHNVDFDLEVLKKKRMSAPKYICTYKLARNMLGQEEGKKDLESYSLQYLRYYLGLYKQEKERHITAHDALSDVYVLKSLFEYLKNSSNLSVENMAMISKQPIFIRTLTFGKYSGQELEDIVKFDREYLEWLRDTVTDKPELQWNIDRVLSLKLL